jgi:cytochrome P450
MTTPGASDIATPPASPGLLGNPGIFAVGARLFAAFSRLRSGPLKVGNKVIVGRHADAVDVLSRDLEFRIGPVNAEKIEAVNGSFVLGMDRGAVLVHERAVLYRALAKGGLAAVRQQVEQQTSDRIDKVGDEIDVVGDYARPIAASTAKLLFGARPSDDILFMDVARAIFGHVFLNLGNDEEIKQRALRAAPHLRNWLKEEIQRRRASGDLGTDMMGALLADPAIPNNDVGNDLVRRTLGGMLVGSIDTTATCIAKIVVMIGQDQTLASGIAADVDNFPRLHGWCWEALRRWPHNPIVLRRAAIDTRIAEVDVRAGDEIYVFTQAAMLDTSVFPEPQVLNPARPLKPYLHFGGGLHPCAGYDVNAFQIPLLVGALVRRGIKSVGTIGWAGPFPDHLTVTFNRRAT